MTARARSMVSGARARRTSGRVATLTRLPVPSGSLTPPLQIALAPPVPFEPAPPATNVEELFAATIRRVAARFTEKSIAAYEDGGPCLPEMAKAEFWSGWGAWWLECIRAGDAVTRTERLEGEKLIEAAFNRRRRIIGYPKSRFLSRDETLDALNECLGYAKKWGRS